MDEKKLVKVSLGTVICIVIICILIIALIGMWYNYNYVKIVDSNIQQGNITELDSENSSQNIAEESNEKLEEDTNTFEVYQENYKNAFKQLINGENQLRIVLDDEYELPGVTVVYIDSNNDAYFMFDKDSQLYSKYGETYKIENDVANIFICPVGNGGYAEAIFLKLDGTASSVSGYALERNSEIKCEKIENVTNAVNVISYSEINGEFGGASYAFIDINGNVIK